MPWAAQPAVWCWLNNAGWKLELLSSKLGWKLGIIGLFRHQAKHLIELQQKLSRGFLFIFFWCETSPVIVLSVTKLVGFNQSWNKFKLKECCELLTNICNVNKAEHKYHWLIVGQSPVYSSQSQQITRCIPTLSISGTMRVNKQSARPRQSLIIFWFQIKGTREALKNCHHWLKCPQRKYFKPSLYVIL